MRRMAIGSLTNDRNIQRRQDCPASPKLQHTDCCEIHQNEEFFPKHTCSRIAEASRGQTVVCSGLAIIDNPARARLPPRIEVIARCGAAKRIIREMSRFLLVFDLDGTLVDSVPDLRAALNQMLRER